MSAGAAASPEPRRRCGFTLVEAVASIVVLSVIGTVSSSLILNSVDGYADAAASARMHLEASTALDRVERELRSIDLDDAAVGIAPDIDSVSPTQISWHGDSSLSLVGSNLRLAMNGGAAATLLSDVSAFSIQTFDESNAALGGTLAGAACDPIRRVRIELTLTRQGASEFLRTRFFVRATMEGGMSLSGLNLTGAAAVAMIAALLVVNLIIIGLALGGARDQDLTVRRLETVRAFYAAEAGMNMAVREMMVTSDEDDDGAIGTISDDANTANDPTLSQAQVLVTQQLAGADTILTSTGRSGEATRSLEATLSP